MLAAIRPGGKPEGIWALPKGLVAPGEDVRYVYSRGGARIFKIVSFYLVRYRRGRVGDVTPEHAHEVEEARWLPLEEAPRLLAYRGEREMADRALAYLREVPE